MMSDKYTPYRQAETTIPSKSRQLPLYGAGFDNLGDLVEKPIPEPAADQMIVRHDAIGLCFSDIKILTQGGAHPRLQGRDLQKDPVVMGHEVVMTVVNVGEQLRRQYKPGDRFIIQADIYVKGVNLAYGYKIDGGLSEYGLIDQRILNGDHGNYLIPVQKETGYAESALAEPWACVVAAYTLKYRTSLKRGGVTWIIGTSSSRDDYTISAGCDRKGHPARIFLTNVPAKLEKTLKKAGDELGIEIAAVKPGAKPPVEKIDDVVVLGPDADAVDVASPFLAGGGIVAVLADKPMPRAVKLDVGRIHYEDWVFVGATGHDIAKAYAQTPVRPDLKGGGKTLFAGAGGPIGRMHLQRAIEKAQCPKAIVCTDASDLRLKDLEDTYADEAKAKGIRFICLNPMQKEAYAKGMAEFTQDGFDDIVVLAPVAPLIAETSHYMGQGAVMNIFAGVARGTVAEVDLSDAYLKQTRIVGHSASTIDDLKEVLRQVESKELATNRSVAAVGSLEASKEGLKAVKEAVFPGKVVIFPHIKELPVTPLSDLKTKLPSVHAKLKNGREWTKEAEEEFLRVMLK
jgi:D-arabinose 1-dehydrogenase-like Zn-dependent alcohol dehydrogenase